jgi:hypothetical protein
MLARLQQKDLSSLSNQEQQHRSQLSNEQVLQPKRIELGLVVNNFSLLDLIE